MPHNYVEIILIKNSYLKLQLFNHFDVAQLTTNLMARMHFWPSNKNVCG